MSSLDLIKPENTNQPVALIIYGEGGLGKSSLAAEFPAVVFIPVESPRVKVQAFPKPEKLTDVYKYLADLVSGEHKFKTLAIDSLDTLETLVLRHVCDTHNKDNIEDFGFGKGFSYALDEHRKIRDMLLELREKRGMEIVLIAHSQRKPYNDPLENAAYDRHSIKLNEKASNLYIEFSDAVLFMSQKVHIKTDGGKTKAYGDGQRVLYTEQRPSHLGKNRFGLPYEIPAPKGQAYASLRSALSIGDESKRANVIADINRMEKLLQDEKMKKNLAKFMSEAGDDLTKLIKIQTQLQNVTPKGNAPHA